MGAFGGYQNEIYLAGLGDVVPELPTDLSRLEALAGERLPATAFGYVAGSAGSAGSEATAHASRDAFESWRIVPRMLRDVTATDLSVTVLETQMPAPVALAPIGVLGIVHPDGEAAVARAAAAVGVPMVVSTVATTTLEAVAAAGGDAPRWFQLYWPRDPDLVVSFLERARVAGYQALVVTLDTHGMGWRPRISTERSSRFFAAPATRTTSRIPSSSGPSAARSTTRTVSRCSGTGRESSATLP